MTDIPRIKADPDDSAYGQGPNRVIIQRLRNIYIIFVNSKTPEQNPLSLIYTSKKVHNNVWRQLCTSFGVTTEYIY